MPAPPLHIATLSAQRISESILICGRVAGAAHITGAADAVLVVGCQQLRLHDCRGVDVFLSCGSRPIIEDCERVRFARLPQEFSALSPVSPRSSRTDTHTGADTGSGTDFWDQVQDFNWIKAEQSPHWSLLAEADAPPAAFWEHLAMATEQSARLALQQMLDSRPAPDN